MRTAATEDLLAARHQRPPDLPLRSRVIAPASQKEISTECSTITCNACRVMKSGSLARGDRPASRNTTCRICRQIPRRGACCRDQGKVDLRAGALATQGEASIRTLRRAILDWLKSTRLNDDDRLRFPPAVSMQRDGKKVEGPPSQPSMPTIRHAILDFFA